MSESWVVSPQHGQWIVRTAGLIPFSFVHAMMRSQYKLALADVIGFLTTVNYWRRPTRGCRRWTDIVCIQLCLALHFAAAWTSPHFYEYVAIVSAGALTYSIGHALQSAGHTDAAMACHVGLHGLAFLSNNVLYWRLGYA